jgi:hypothetical protein
MFEKAMKHCKRFLGAARINPEIGEHPTGGKYSSFHNRRCLIQRPGGIEYPVHALSEVESIQNIYGIFFCAFNGAPCFCSTDIEKGIPRLISLRGRFEMGYVRPQNFVPTPIPAPSNRNQLIRKLDGFFNRGYLRL